MQGWAVTPPVLGIPVQAGEGDTGCLGGPMSLLPLSPQPALACRLCIASSELPSPPCVVLPICFILLDLARHSVNSLLSWRFAFPHSSWCCIPGQVVDA